MKTRPAGVISRAYLHSIARSDGLTAFVACGTPAPAPVASPVTSLHITPRAYAGSTLRNEYSSFTSYISPRLWLTTRADHMHPSMVFTFVRFCASFFIIVNPWRMRTGVTRMRFVWVSLMEIGHESMAKIAGQFRVVIDRYSLTLMVFW